MLQSMFQGVNQNHQMIHSGKRLALDPLKNYVEEDPEEAIKKQKKKMMTGQDPPSLVGIMSHVVMKKEVKKKRIQRRRIQWSRGGRPETLTKGQSKSQEGREPSTQEWQTCPPAFSKVKSSIRVFSCISSRKAKRGTCSKGRAS